MARRSPILYPPTLVHTATALSDMLSRLMVEPIVAVDTESNSLYAYSERVCLIQFSVPGEDFFVDPLALEDLSSLGAFLADAGVEKVFHAAEYDVMVLHRDYRFQFANLFDTMIASRIVGWRRYGLGSLLEEHFGVQTNKRMQRTNWGQRPLSSEQIAYAQVDTHYLIPLRDKLMAELVAQGRVGEARAAFARVAESRWTGKGFDPDGFWRIKGANDLDDAGLSVLQALYLYRDRRARALDRPPFKVIGDRTLIELSRRRPRSFAELGRIKGVPRRLSAKRRRGLLAVIEDASDNARPARPEVDDARRPDEETIDRYEALRSWRNDCADERGVEPDVILSNRTLRSLARHNPTSPEDLRAVRALSEWERKRYGREIVALLRRHRRMG